MAQFDVYVNPSQSSRAFYLTPQMASLPTKRLHDPIGTLAHLRDRIIGAVDFALTGF